MPSILDKEFFIVFLLFSKANFVIFFNSLKTSILKLFFGLKFKRQLSTSGLG